MTATHIVLDDGTEVWRSDPPPPDGAWWTSGHFHRDDGPAIVMPDGTAASFRYGRLHREGGPAIVHPDGTEAWYRDGEPVDEEGT